jgi:hypothetical protein
MPCVLCLYAASKQLLLLLLVDTYLHLHGLKQPKELQLYSYMIQTGIVNTP